MWRASVQAAIVLLFTLRAEGAGQSPRDALNELNGIRLDSQAVYTIRANDRVELRQPDITISFLEGKLAFYQRYEGHITGFVYSGLGHVLALPRDSTEKQQIARFLKAPILDQQFVSGYFRFTDDSAERMLAELNRAEIEPKPDNPFVALWDPQVQQLNPTHSMRILLEKYFTSSRHFFHADIDGVVTGPFDIVLDNSRVENFSLGQTRRAGNETYYDVWSSYTLPASTPIQPSFEATHYGIDTTIRPDNSLVGDTQVRFRATQSPQQILFVSLARTLKVESVANDNGAPLPFFQNEGMTELQLRSRGDDILCVFLPKVPKIGDVFTLRFRYHGNVISDAGNGVLFVGARESWYPHFGDTGDFSLYDLTLRWPKRLRLVASGEKAEEREAGEFQIGRWTTSLPVAEAGFNLGEYATFSVTSATRTVDVYANRQLEEAIRSKLAEVSPQFERDMRIAPGESPLSAQARKQIPNYTPSPADALKQIAHEVDSSIAFYEEYSGPFPFRRLGVSQIPGTFGQGWPGLLYISTLSFLSPEAQERAGLNKSGREQFRELVPFHEVAHQWWGNVVGWNSYRDQWLDEAIASYLALLFAQAEKNPEHAVRVWLERYRKQLVTKNSDDDREFADVGPLVMGSRLLSSRSPEAYEAIVYAKGAWVIHMIHEMLEQPGSRDPEARFKALLRSLVTKYAQKSLSTAQFRHEVEAVMTPKMDLEGGHSMEWFFEEYVQGTGIPRYKVEFTSRKTEKGYQVRGKLLESGVPRSFIAPVPLYINSSAGKNVFLGTVVATGEETSFVFSSTAEARKVLIDPNLTLLCVPE